MISEQDELIQKTILFIDEQKKKGFVSIAGSGATNWTSPTGFGIYSQLENIINRYPNGLHQLRKEIKRLYVKG
jgi:hypothetical protein